MSRCKTTSSTKPSPSDNTTFVSQTTAIVLHKAGIINYCNKLLQALLEYWRNTAAEEGSLTVGGNLLKEHLPHPPPDMTPFFLRQFVKGILIPLLICNFLLPFCYSRVCFRCFPNLSSTSNRNGVTIALSNPQTS